MPQKWKIAILGAGNVGGALGRIWAAQNHDVVFGVPNPTGARVVEAVAAANGKAKAAKNSEAASNAEIVACCVPWTVARQAILDAGDLSGRILIDCTNPLSSDLKGLVVGHTTSAAEMIAGWAPGARVVKAFNTIGAMHFGNARFDSLRADGFYCGDDAAAKAVVRDLIAAADLEPVDVGPLSNARLLEPLAMLWIDLAINQGRGIDQGFKLLRR